MIRCRSSVSPWLVAAVSLSVLATSCSFNDKVDAAEVSEVDRAITEEPVTLRVGHTGALVSDPLSVQPLDAASVLLADALTDGLTVLGDDGSVMPGVAASWTTTDGITWRFVLGNRSWPDGTAIASNDVIVSLERVLSNAATSLHGARLAAVVADGGVATDGDSAIIITTREVNYELPAILAAVPYGILRAADIVAGGVGLDVAGGGLSTSGPFEVALAAKDSPLVSLKRSRFGDAAAAQDAVPGEAEGPTAPSELELVRYSAPAMALDALGAGEVDVAQIDESTEVPAGVSVVKVDGAVVYAAVGSQRALGDAGVRGGVLGSVAGGPSSVSALFAGGVAACAACDVAVGDVAVAAGAPIRLVVGAGSRLAAAGTALADRLVAAGLVVERVDTTKESMAAALDGTADVTVFVAPGLTTSVDVSMSALFGLAGAENIAGYSSAAFDAALGAARATADDAARKSAYEAALTTLAADGPAVALDAVGTTWAIGPRVSGARPRAGRVFNLDVVTVTP